MRLNNLNNNSLTEMKGQIVEINVSDIQDKEI